MRPRVLVIAEAANPDWVSVPLIGWSLARALAEVADVHLVTQVRNRAAIIAAGLTEGDDFTAIDSEALARPLWALGGLLRMGEGKGWTALQAVSAISYPYFERLVWKRFGAEIRKGRYDVVHRITPLSPTQSGPLAAHCARAGVPYVIGPLNGGVPWPREFEAARRAEREWLSYVRGIYRYLPGRKSMLDATRCILAGSRHTATEFEQWQDRTIWLPENAIDPVRFPDLPRPPTSGPLRACFIGRMVPYKGPDMLLEAASELLRSGRMTLDLIGDGPMMEELRKQAAPLGQAVRLHGWLPHDKVQSVAGKCSLLAFPSVREFGGGVVLEAMAMGLAPLIVDYAGPGELVTDQTGYKVALGDRDAIVARFRSELNRLADDPEDVAARGACARAVARQNFTWSAKAGQVAEVYDWITGKREVRPDFTGVTRYDVGRYSDVAG
ncbi:glycosyltransferase family 4 protein [Ponticoccus sp. SC2-23]|uniref:glycosyltransferase family 4 protein n=1 Tax=Alexandriicola marinus TaxID=2081710 RepID=UPI00193B5DFB|nr:glycosyltransferase family 4 protein [Alexandriicola marinus]MBM1220415.1 glycosyltransferase family 4 protein [Ponticoccus sp. SC6-9]MBM1225101.1 glycosyltransferase family 4 protein [Ponticoccus sp. SC6-15]MBM1228615.1 glycosyltransferase family 4 protein [Ponticoccus sp. SC6-38]MBM1233748.1 glycosyltransferase family 4 protein [Ponticoccus sp. SC6-45]MBM1239116.1 glycosyltransferase family 4 protein [Ponticoccus sp. SC6-49]MBM1242898.1 glycosyltransferase family 4 protein [Ponticoccus s